MLTARGVIPQPAAVAYGLPIAVRTDSEAVSLAVILEERTTAAYLRLVVLEDTASCGHSGRRGCRRLRCGRPREAAPSRPSGLATSARFLP